MLDINLHKNIFIKILKDIYTDSFLGPRLGFKGGTAAYLFYDLNRFSVDLDFDLLDQSEEERVFQKIKKIVEKYGIIKDEKNKKFTLLILLSYSDGSRNLKIEINKRKLTANYEVKNYLGISMLVMCKPDMFAHKLVAMTQRNKTANRDIFDVYFFLDSDWDINKEIVEKRTNMNFKNYLEKCVKFIEKTPNRNILSGMGELLGSKKKKWIKNNLKKELIFLLKLKIKNEESK
jgi:predicted nucleotidyltransferase component of viral defense system